MDLIALVHEDIKDLLPNFLLNRREEVLKLTQKLSEGDLKTLQFLGERMYALGNPYGFRYITTCGKRIREAVRNGDLTAVAAAVSAYGEYLNKVEIRIVPKDVERIAWSQGHRSEPEIEADLSSGARADEPTSAGSTTSSVNDDDYHIGERGVQRYPLGPNRR